MKHVFYLVGLLCVTANTLAQNLVPNPSFETYIHYPKLPGQIDSCAGWYSYTDGSPDYFNAGGGANVGVPNNQFGYEAAGGGNAYTGVVDYYYSSSTPGIDYKEYIAAAITPLIKGATYEVSMLVSLADNVKYASNGLGAYFFKNAPTVLPGVSGRLTNAPQVSYASYGPITNKSGWKKLKQKFVADSAYDHIVIGGFLSDAAIATSLQSSGSFLYSYYYIDSVSVKFADTVSLDVTGNMFCVGNNMTVNYTVNNAVVFNPGNVFTLQLSNSVGNFSTPLNIGSVSATGPGTINATLPTGLLSGGGYRVRIVSSDPAYVSADNGTDLGIGSAAPIPVATITSPICEGDTFTMSVTSANSFTDAEWNGPKYQNTHAASITSFTSTLADAGIYTVKASNYGCPAATASVVLTINPVPARPHGNSNSPVCSGDTLVLNGQSTGASDTWKSSTSTFFTKNVKVPVSLSDSGIYVLSTTLNGCSSRDTIRVTVKESPVPAPLANHPCEGETLTISSAYNSAGASYSWMGPAGFTSTQQKNDISKATLSASGKYYVTVTGANGCKGTDSVTATVKPLPPHTAITGNKLYCEGDSIWLYAQNNAAGMYSWAGPSGFSSLNQNLYIPHAALTHTGVYTVTANLNGCTSSDTTAILVKDAPSVPNAFANTPLMEGQDLKLEVSNIEKDVAYQWTGPAGFSANAPIATIANIRKEHAGTYFIIGVLNGCRQSNLVLVTVDSKPDSTGLLIYPNANNGDFLIKSSVKFEQQITTYLYNDRGQIVFKATTSTQNKLFYQPISLHHAVADGVYMLRMDIDGKKVVERIVIKN